MKLACIILLILTFAILIGCSQPAPPLSPATTQTPTTVPPTSEPSSEPESTKAPTSSNGTPADLDAARGVVFDYWSAFNSYDVERALSYYEENYREQEREDVESDIGRVKAFGITLEVEEVSEPVLIPEDKVEYEIRLDTPIGYRYILYELIQVGGEWKICLEASIEKLSNAKEFIISFLAKYGEPQRIDIMINAEQKEGIKRAVLDRALSDLVKSGEVVELRQGFYSLPGEQ